MLAYNEHRLNGIRFDRWIVFLFSCSILLLPYIFLLLGLGKQVSLDQEETIWALRNSFEQGFYSMLLSLFMSCFLLPGYWFFKGKFKFLLQIILLLPSFVPPLFIVMSFFWWMNPFPIGTIGVVLVQGSMNAGLLTVLIDRSIDKHQGIIDAALVMGAKRFRIIFEIFRIIRSEISLYLLMIFTFCFSSFSIPILVGGNRSTNLEVLIYEKLRLDARAGEALTLSLLQLFLISFLSLILLKFNGKTNFEWKNSSEYSTKRLSNTFSLFLIFIYSIFFILPLVLVSCFSLRSLLLIDSLPSEILSLLPDTLFMAFASSLIFLILAVIYIWGFPLYYLPRLSKSWISPSLAVLGFSFWLLPASSSLIVYAISLAIFFFISVYRMIIDPKLETLRGQINVARVMGASDSLIWKQILLPQLWPTICFSAGIVAVWSLGEFALGKILLSQTRTWAQLAEDLMSSYRIDQALALEFLILILACLFLLFYRSLGRVYR